MKNIYLKKERGVVETWHCPICADSFDCTSPVSVIACSCTGQRMVCTKITMSTTEMEERLMLRFARERVL